MEVRTETKLVELLTGAYQISGKLEVRGNPAVYLNDQTVETFTIHDVTLAPLAVGTQIGAMNLPVVYIPKREAQVILMDISLQEASLLPTRIPLVCFTDTYVIRGNFVVGTETSPTDVFTAAPGPFFPATGAEVLAMRPLTQEIGGQADLLYVRGTAVRTFYNPGE